ncbi:ribonuclease P protein component [Krasilnikovia sp. MM14-A1259]|uniref:ribonuclease P protein component n=1 Tax=Krasilnikovia sp. MM14-A1259 TaxID=3373539 RepID=UPI00381676C9
MLAAAQRLRRSTDFAAAVRGGRRAGRSTLVVHLSIPPISDEPAPAESSDSPARAGFVVSKAVGNAVVRNRVRRRLRHLVRPRLATLPPGALLVVRALPAAAAASGAALDADLGAALAAASAPRRGRGR